MAHSDDPTKSDSAEYTTPYDNHIAYLIYGGSRGTGYMPATPWKATTSNHSGSAPRSELWSEPTSDISSGNTSWSTATGLEITLERDPANDNILDSVEIAPSLRQITSLRNYENTSNPRISIRAHHKTSPDEPKVPTDAKRQSNMRPIAGGGPFQPSQGNGSTDRQEEDIPPGQANLDADRFLDNPELGEEWSLSDGDDVPRSPSPWQDACSQDGGLFSWLQSGVNDDIRSSHGCASTSDNSETASQAADPVEGLTTCPVGRAFASASGSGSGSGSPPATGLLVPDMTTVTTTGLVGSKRPMDERNQDDEDEDVPDRKRAKGTTAETPFTRPRFACPYQKYDPLGSPFCCMPSSKNPQGGAETFPRVKSHIFRNHDPLVRCSNCWKMCKTEHDAQMHRTVTDCIPRASPSKYWMTREQCVQVRQRRFVAANSIDNWYCLFGILLPNVPTQGLGGKKISPYFVTPRPRPPSPPTPAPSSVDSGNRSVSDQQSHIPDPIPPYTQPAALTGSIAASQPFALAIQPTSTTNMGFPPSLNDFDFDLAINDILQVRDTNDISIRPSTHSVGAFVSENTYPLMHQDQTTTPSFFGLDGTTTTTANASFLQQDNARLRNSGDQLRVEVELVRQRNSELQARLDETRERLGPLERSLQDLLYLPDIQKGGGDEVSNRLFAVLDRVMAMNVALSSGLSRD